MVIFFVLVLWEGLLVQRTMASCCPTSYQHGQIHSHQRDAYFTGELLGDNIVLDPAYVTSVQETEVHKIDVKTKLTHHNCIKQFYNLLEHKFLAYYEVGVNALLDDEMGDATTYYWKNTHDLIYSGMNTKFLKFFCQQN